jgi:hypothetical protein
MSQQIIGVCWLAVAVKCEHGGKHLKTNCMRYKSTGTYIACLLGSHISELIVFKILHQNEQDA